MFPGPPGRMTAQRTTGGKSVASLPAGFDDREPLIFAFDRIPPLLIRQLQVARDLLARTTVASVDAPLVLIQVPGRAHQAEALDQAGGLFLDELLPCPKDCFCLEVEC